MTKTANDLDRLRIRLSRTKQTDTCKGRQKGEKALGRGGYEELEAGVVKGELHKLAAL